ncbi:MAG: hypothetical protein AAF907_13295, partial [Planctomycetota bacterium]
MKFSLAGLKNANWKQIGIDHGEKAGLAVAALFVGAFLYSTPWGSYTKKEPGEIQTNVDQQKRLMLTGSFSEERRQEDWPVFDVASDASRVMEKVEPGSILLPTDLRAPIYPPQAPGGEPTWLPVEEVLVKYVQAPVRLTDEGSDRGTDAGKNPPGDDEPAEEPDRFELNPDAASGRFGGDFGPGSLFPGGEGFPGEEGDSPFPRDDDDRFGGPGGLFGEEGPMFGDEDGRGGNAGLTSKARGRGVKMAAVRGVFPYRSQVQELAKSLNVSFNEAKPRLEFLEVEIQRQRAAPGPNPWIEDWEDVDRQAAEDLLGEDRNASTGRAIEVVSPGLTDPTLTMPLFTRAFGSWANRSESTHPRIKE